MDINSINDIAYDEWFRKEFIKADTPNKKEVTRVTRPLNLPKNSKMNTITESPFLHHRELILQGGSYAVESLGSLVLNLYYGKAFPFDCSEFRGLDKHNYSIALEMINSYYRNGKNDEELIKLAGDLKEFRKARDEARPTIRIGHETFRTVR